MLNRRRNFGSLPLAHSSPEMCWSYNTYKRANQRQPAGYMHRCPVGIRLCVLCIFGWLCCVFIEPTAHVLHGIERVCHVEVSTYMYFFFIGGRTGSSRERTGPGSAAIQHKYLKCICLSCYLILYTEFGLELCMKFGACIRYKRCRRFEWGLSHSVSHSQQICVGI